VILRLWGEEGAEGGYKWVPALHVVFLVSYTKKQVGENSWTRRMFRRKPCTLRSFSVSDGFGERVMTFRKHDGKGECSRFRQQTKGRSGMKKRPVVKDGKVASGRG